MHTTLTTDQIVGNAGSTKGDVVETFNSFRKATKPVLYKAFLHYYSTINSTVLVGLGRLRACVQGFCTLRGALPHWCHPRNSWRVYQASEGDRGYLLKTSLDKLNTLYKLLWLCLQRQDLVIHRRIPLYTMI